MTSILTKLSSVSLIFFDFGSSYDTLDHHETTVDQQVSTTYPLPPFLSRYPLYSRVNRMMPTSVIATAIIIMRGTHERLITMPTLGHGKKKVNSIGCTARTRSGWLLRMRSDGMGSARN